MGNERSTCCEKLEVGAPGEPADLTLMDAHSRALNVAGQSISMITSLEENRNEAGNPGISSDLTHVDTVLSKALDSSMIKEFDLITAISIHDNQVSTKMSMDASQSSIEKSCVNSNHQTSTEKNTSRGSTFQRKTEKRSGTATDKSTKSESRSSNIRQISASKISGPKLGTISGSATDRCKSPSQYCEESGKINTNKSTGSRHDELSISSMFPSLFSRSAPSELSNSAPNSTTSQSQRPIKIPLFVPLKIPEVPKKSKDSKGDVTRFRSDYANKFAIGSRHTVDFFGGSFDDAQKESKNSTRLILIFIHDPTNQDSIKFIHESLNSIEFGEFVSRNQVIVWGIANDSDEGKYVAFHQHVYRFPYVGLMCPRADGRFFTARRITGFTTTADLVDKLQKSTNVLQSELKEYQRQRELIMENRRLMQEQEKAYKESAEKDKQKMLQAKKARQEKLEAEQKKKEKEKDTEKRKQIIAEKRGELKLQAEQQPTGNDVVNVQVRFPSGKKFAKKFDLDDSLEKLFLAILCYETCPDFFTVATGFPRSEIHCAPEWYHSLLSAQLVADGLSPSPFRPPSSFRAAGLGKAVGVFVNNHGVQSDGH